MNYPRRRQSARLGQARTRRYISIHSSSLFYSFFASASQKMRLRLVTEGLVRCKTTALSEYEKRVTDCI